MGNNVSVWQSGHNNGSIAFGSSIASALSQPSLDDFITSLRHPHKYIDATAPAAATISNGGSLPCGASRNVMIAWRANEATNGSFGIDWQPVDITVNTDVKSTDCFIVAHLQELGAKRRPSAQRLSTATAMLLDKLSTSINTDDLATPLGLTPPSAITTAASSSSSSSVPLSSRSTRSGGGASPRRTLVQHVCCDIYVWTGKRASVITRTLAVAKGWQLRYALVPTTASSAAAAAAAVSAAAATGTSGGESPRTALLTCQAILDKLFYGVTPLRLLSDALRGHSRRPSLDMHWTLPPQLARCLIVTSSLDQDPIPVGRAAPVIGLSDNDDSKSSTNASAAAGAGSPDHSPRLFKPPPLQTDSSTPMPSPGMSHLNLQLPFGSPSAQRSPAGGPSSPVRRRPLGIIPPSPVGSPGASPRSPSDGGYHPNFRRARSRGARPETDRAAKLAYFGKHCTKLTDYLYVGSKVVAQDLPMLKSNGITHVVNCVGDLCENYFEPELTYMRLFLMDNAQEDIMCVAYDVFDFIDQARQRGGITYIHCQQGVSRSCVMCIGYMMYLENKEYDEVYQYVRERRGICRPNVGFMCQLLAWRKRCVGRAKRPYMYRIAPHCSRARNRLVTKWVERVEVSHLDERGVFVLQTPERVYVWVGSMCRETDKYLQTARTLIERLQRHEHAPPLVTLIYSGRAEGTPTPHPPPLNHPSSLDTSHNDESPPASARHPSLLHAIPEGSSAESSPAGTPQTQGRHISPRFGASATASSYHHTPAVPSSRATTSTSAIDGALTHSSSSNTLTVPGAPLISLSPLPGAAAPSAGTGDAIPDSPRSPNTTSSPPSSPPHHRSASDSSDQLFAVSAASSPAGIPTDLPTGFAPMPVHTASPSAPNTPMRIAASPMSFRSPLAQVAHDAGGLAAVTEADSSDTARSSTTGDNDDNNTSMEQSTSGDVFDSPADGFWRCLGLSEPLFQLPVPTNDDYDDDYCIDEDEPQDDDDDIADSPSARLSVQRAREEEDKDFGAVGARPPTEDDGQGDRSQNEDDDGSGGSDEDYDGDNSNSARHRVTVEPPSTRGRGNKGGFSFPPPPSLTNHNSYNNDNHADNHQLTAQASPVPRLNLAGIQPDGSVAPTRAFAFGSNVTSGVPSLSLKLSLPTIGAPTGGHSPVPSSQNNRLPSLNFAGVTGYAGATIPAIAIANHSNNNSNNDDDENDGSRLRRRRPQNEPEPEDDGDDDDDDNDNNSDKDNRDDSPSVQDDEDDAPASTRDRAASAPRASIPRSALPGLSLPSLGFGNSPHGTTPSSSQNSNSGAPSTVVPPLRFGALVTEAKETNNSAPAPVSSHRHHQHAFAPSSHSSTHHSAASSGSNHFGFRTTTKQPRVKKPVVARTSDVHPKSVTAKRKAADAAAAAARRAGHRGTTPAHGATPHSTHSTPHSSKHTREAHAPRVDVEQVANAGGSLWEWPELDELEHYDTGDLYPDRVYALLQQEAPSEADVHVWFGAEFKLPSTFPTQQAFAQHVTDTLISRRLPFLSEARVVIKVEVDGQESSDFFDGFING